jgi:hypothetical protein
MGFRDLVQWIGSQGVAIEERNTKKDKALALAQKIWDAAESGIIDKMKKRRQSPRRPQQCQNSSGPGGLSANDQKGLATMD